MSNERTRPRALQRLHDCLAGKPYVHVYEVYRALRGRPWPGDLPGCQRQLGTTITRFNRFPHECRVVLGPEVYTYRLHEG
jgi:hypothetical protein